MSDDRQAEFMFVNPLLAMALEASLLERDIIEKVVGPGNQADMRKRLVRIMDLARKVRGIELPLRVAIGAEHMPASPEPRKEYRFPVIDGGKQ